MILAGILSGSMVTNSSDIRAIANDLTSIRAFQETCTYSTDRFAAADTPKDTG